MKKIAFIAFILLLVFNVEAQKPKYIFLFIGDGMGMVQVQLTDHYMRSVKSDSLTFTGFPVLGFQTTHSSDSRITDSAAAGTALATGFKTKSGSIGIASNGRDTLKSFAYKARELGYKIGILTSVSIDHATPASFYANARGRRSYHTIGMQLPETGFDFFAGGSFLDPVSFGGNVFEKLDQFGYLTITSPDSLKYAAEPGRKVCVLDPDKEFYYGIDREEGRFTLPGVTRAAIENLYNPKGFFMMVEGGKIDWSSHDNDPGTTIYETIEFEMAVREALRFYELYPEETLIIVTADHETGGMSFGSFMSRYRSSIELVGNQKKSQRAFVEILKNEFVDETMNFEKTMDILGRYYNVNKEDGLEFISYDSLRISMAIDFVNHPERFTDEIENYKTFGNNNTKVTDKPEDRFSAIAYTMHYLLSQKSGIGWTTGAHSGVAVPVFAIGAGSDIFRGFYDNTDIAKRISEIFE